MLVTYSGRTFSEKIERDWIPICCSALRVDTVYIIRYMPYNKPLFFTTLWYGM